MSIGQRITELRKQQDISQLQLAKALDVSRQAVSKWENDQTSPDTIKLIQLAEVLDTEVEYLATGVKPVYQNPPVVINLVEKVEKVVEKEIERPVIKHIVRVKHLRNPIEFSLVGILCFAIGLLLGLLF